MLPSRYAYSISPEQVVTNGANESSLTSLDLNSIDSFRERWENRYEWISRSFRFFYEENTGLLLITASQAFFSAMDVAVKKLHTVDPPVSTLQVGVIISLVSGQSHLLKLVLIRMVSHAFTIFYLLSSKFLLGNHIFLLHLVHVILLSFLYIRT